MRVRRTVAADFSAAFADVDVLLGPVSPGNRPVIAACVRRVAARDHQAPNMSNRKYLDRCAASELTGASHRALGALHQRRRTT